MILFGYVVVYGVERMIEVFKYIVRLFGYVLCIDNQFARLETCPVLNDKTKKVIYFITGDQDVVEQVLAMQDEVGGDLELVVEQTLVTQASRLLEETDFTNVLNQIPPDEFNDLFAGELINFTYASFYGIF